MQITVAPTKYRIGNVFSNYDEDETYTVTLWTIPQEFSISDSFSVILPAAVVRDMPDVDSVTVTMTIEIAS